jgi:hypothetical protein
MKKGKTTFVVIMILLLTSLNIGAPLALEKGVGAIRKYKFLSENLDLQNATSTWMDAFNTNIRLKGAGTQCVDISFSAEVVMNGTGTPNTEFQVLVDGEPANPADNPPFETLSRVHFYPTRLSYLDLASYNWWKCGLEAGGKKHNIQVQFRRGNTDTVVVLYSRSLKIGYKK